MPLLLLVGLLGCASPEDPAFGTSGSGASSSPLVLTDVAHESDVHDRGRRLRGVAAADFDGDGLLDLYMANPHDPATLLLGDGDGGFWEQPDAPTTGVDTTAVPADFDGDGDIDLFLGCGGWTATCADMLLRNDGVVGGALVFTDVSADAGIAGTSRRTFGAAWADIDGDGDLDLFVSAKRDWAGNEPEDRDLLWRNEGDGTFTDISEQAGVDATGGQHQPSFIDMDEDGDEDLFVPTLLGEDHLYENDGTGAFTRVTPTVMADLHQSFASAVADVDADGHLDIIVSANADSTWLDDDRGEDSRVYLGDGDGGFRAVALSTLLGEASPHTQMTMGFQVGDLDMDGQPELFFGNGQPEGGAMNELFSVTGRGATLQAEDLSDQITVQATGADGTPWPYRTHGTIVADFDRDGWPDLFVGNGGMHMDASHVEPNRLFMNRTEGEPSRLTVQLEGADANLDAVGAVVRVWSDDDDRVLTQRVTAGGGFNSGLVDDLAFGLDGREGPFTVQVTWPGGEVEEQAAEAGQRVRFAR